MNHEIHSVVRVENVKPYVLRLDFADGKTTTINFLPMLRGEMYGPLRDLKVFNQVRLDSDTATIVWPNGADFDPATLHDWENVGTVMVAMAQTWDDFNVPSIEGSYTATRE